MDHLYELKVVVNPFWKKRRKGRGACIFSLHGEMAMATYALAIFVATK